MSHKGEWCLIVSDLSTEWGSEISLHLLYFVLVFPLDLADHQLREVLQQPVVQHLQGLRPGQQDLARVLLPAAHHQQRRGDPRRAESGWWEAGGGNASEDESS